MKKLVLSTLFLSLGSGVFAQKAPIDFEPGGNGANWTWATFEAPAGEDNPEFSVSTNPSVDAINGSANVAKMAINYGTADGWGSAGCESKHGADIGTFAVTVSNSKVKMMVYQEGFAAPVALKFATSSGGAYPEVVVQNTVADAWVEVEFDMSRWIDGLGGDNPDQIIFFPSYAVRTGGHTVYFDNVTFSGLDPIEKPSTAAPKPSQSASNVMSVFSQITGAPNPSSHYTDIANTDFNPNWGGNSGNTVIEAFDGDLALTYPELDYQGTLIGGAGSSSDVSKMTSMHFDYWTDGGTSLKVTPISTTSAEIDFDVFKEMGALPQKQWVSVDIPLSHFVGYDFNLKELKFHEGGGKTFHFDNIFFTNEVSTGTIDVAENLVEIFPNPSTDFWTVKTNNVQVSSLIVCDAMGKHVMSLNPNNTKLVIDGSGLKPGMYFALIKTETGMNTLKLIKK